MNLIILTESDQVGPSGYLLKDGRAEHIIKVLQLGAGDRLEIGILNGPVGTAAIERVDKSAVHLTDLELVSDSNPVTEVDIICALPRPQILKRVLFTSAMMGVRQLHLIRANRVEKSYFQSPILGDGKIKALLIEGLSQGKRTRLPQVHIHKRFRPFFEDTLDSLDWSDKGKSRRLLADLDAGLSLSEVSLKQQENVIAAIGPEGGWVPFEVKLMQNIGFETFSLGSSVLRVDSALVATMAQLELMSMMHR